MDAPHISIPPETSAGYNGLAQETTAGRKDMREQLEFGLEMPAEKWTTSDPPHMRLHGPNQWPTLATDNGGAHDFGVRLRVAEGGSSTFVSATASLFYRCARSTPPSPL